MSGAPKVGPKQPIGPGGAVKIALCYVEHEIDMYRVKGKDDFSVICFFEDSRFEKRLYVSVNRLDVPAGPARRFERSSAPRRP